ncbi:MAG: hypothetical protein IK080_04815 [Clostridia bacterium]|nr:hypothetical protein [Clostridia bacterium]
MKKALAILLALAAVLSVLSLAAYATRLPQQTGVQTCTDPSDMLNFVLNDAPKCPPIRIVEAKLKENGRTKWVYLLGLVGTDNVDGQTNNLNACFKSAFNKDNDYLQQVKATLADVVPRGSALVIAGHSLGGMVAQQLIADEEIKAAYNIIGTVCGGSPLIEVNNEQEGSLCRMVDRFDIISILSGATFTNPRGQFNDCLREDGGWFFKPDEAHNISYRTKSEWQAYDIFGVKGGGATLTYDYADIMIFGGPEG